MEWQTKLERKRNEAEKVFVRWWWQQFSIAYAEPKGPLRIEQIKLF